MSAKKIPQRIVSLAPSNTEILFALGLGNRVVGVTRYCDYPEEVRKKKILDGFANPDLDKIVALKPDLIIAFGTIQKPLVYELERRGQTVFWFYPHTVKEILDSFEQIGKVTGSLSAAHNLRKNVERKMSELSDKVGKISETERPGVFRIMNLNPIGTIGGNAFQTEIYHLAGGKNIFAGVGEDYFVTDIKTLLELDPDIIVVAGRDREETKARISRLEGWGSLTAVKTGRIAVILPELVCRPGPRIGLTIERLAQEFHPDIFHSTKRS